MNTRSTGTSARPCQAPGPCSRSARAIDAAARVRLAGRVGDRAGDGQRVLRAGAPRHHRRDGRGVQRELRVEHGALVAGQVRQRATASSQCVALRRVGAALEVGVGRLVRRHHAGARRRPRSTCCTASAGPPSTGRGWRSRHTRSRARSRRPRRSSAMIARITSLPVTPGASAPSTVMRMVLGLRCHSVCVASTCSTSDEPMPNASAPTAPWVEVWLSPQTSSAPGWLMPSSGPTTWTMPCRGSSSPNSVMPVWRGVPASAAPPCRAAPGRRSRPRRGRR